MTEAVFLSASVPDPRRSPEFAETADPVAITAAVSALVFVTLGRRMLIWGGHPAITPMIVAVAENMGVDYGQWVKLYQSSFFEDEYPEDNDRFKNVNFTNSIAGDRETSLLLMRESMLKNNAFSAGVFIGGMKGIVDEFALFRALQPSAAVVPLMSTGGAVLEIAKSVSVAKDLSDDLDYVAVLHRHLGIKEQEERYETPAEQPKKLGDRLWRKKS